MAFGLMGFKNFKNTQAVAALKDLAQLYFAD